MFGLSEYSSLTWDSAAWIYSVIIGVVLVRYFMFIANLLQEPKAIKFYYPYLAFMLASILNLYVSWYTAKQAYTDIEGKTLVFAIRSFLDAIGCIVGLIIVPQDKLLEDFFDMKSWFMKVKRVFCFIMAFYFLTWVIMTIALSASGQHFEIDFVILLLVIILLNVGSAFSKNVYYLSFHGTLMVLMSLRNLSRL